uniref:Uncharacterized protein n=1 Tax=Bionectria ochroleuca TaxID=29856 RepID=A0A8H7K8X1_BIOOC
MFKPPLRSLQDGDVDKFMEGFRTIVGPNASLPSQFIDAETIYEDMAQKPAKKIPIPDKRRRAQVATGKRKRQRRDHSLLNAGQMLSFRRKIMEFAASSKFDKNLVNAVRNTANSLFKDYELYFSSLNNLLYNIYSDNTVETLRQLPSLLRESLIFIYEQLEEVQNKESFPLFPENKDTDAQAECVEQWSRLYQRCIQDLAERQHPGKTADLYQKSEGWQETVFSREQEYRKIRNLCFRVMSHKYIVGEMTTWNWQ